MARADPEICGLVIETAEQCFADGVVPLGELDRYVPVLRRRNVRERALVIADLEIGELEATCRRDHDRALVLLDLAARRQLLERRERDPRVRTCTQAAAVGA